MNHSTIKATILPTEIQLILEKHNLTEVEALDTFYRSATGEALADDETGLYGQSPNHIFSLYVQEQEGA